MWEKHSHKKLFNLLYFIPSHAIKIMKNIFFVTLQKRDNNNACEEHFSRSCAEIRKSHRHVAWSMNHLSSFIEFYESYFFFDAKTLSARLHLCAFCHHRCGNSYFWKNLKVFDMNDQSWSIKLFVWGNLTPFGVFYSNIL